MTANVEQLGRRDEVAELIEWHFQIIRAFLPDDQSNGARRRAEPVVGSHIHCRLLLSGFEIESRGKNVKSARDWCRKSARRSRAPPKGATPHGTAGSG